MHFYKKFGTKRLLLFLLSLVIGSSLLLPLLFSKKQSNFDRFLSEQFIGSVSSNTLNLHYTLSNPKAAGIKSYEVSLFYEGEYDPSQSAREYKQLQNRLRDFSYDSLSAEEQLVYDIYADYLNRQSRLLEFPLYQEILSPSGGVSSQLPILLAEYKFTCKKDIEDYLLLLSQMDSYFEQILRFEQKKADAGLFMSDVNCQKVIMGCEVWTKHPHDNFLYDTFCSRLKQVKGLSAKEQKEYESKHKKMMEEHVIPAYQCLASGLTKLMGKGRNDWGLCYYKDGADYYEALLCAYTGSDETAEEWFEAIKAKRNSDLAVCEKLLKDSPQPLTDATQTMFAYDSCEDMVSRLQQAITQEFPAPVASTWEICYVDPSLKDYLAPAFYITAPIDAYLENRIYINDAGNDDKLQLFATLAHEGFPGHLYQTMQSYAYGMNPLHTLLNYPGYTEGWATYVELLSYQYMGLDTSLATLLQYNQSVLLSLYASSDIGVHYYGWKNEELSAFWADYGITDPDTIQTISRLICEEPGNYLKYYGGYLKFCALRDDYAKKQKGHFEPISFHQKILEIGPAPFALLHDKLCN